MHRLLCTLLTGGFLIAAAVSIAAALEESADLVEGLNALRRGDYLTAQPIICAQPVSPATAARFVSKISMSVREPSRNRAALLKIADCVGQKIKGKEFGEAQFRLSRLVQSIDGALRYEWLRTAAENDHAEAAYLIAKEHQRATGVPDMEFLRLAAELGFPQAQQEIARILRGERGWGTPSVEADYSEALKWFEKLAAREHDDSFRSGAQAQLGWMYYRGEGVEQNYDAAFKWFTLAVSGIWDTGAYSAAYGLAEMYKYGHGVDKDPQKAQSWAKKSARPTKK
jgi:tetratricopeptide (TPR) repeat protein